MVDLTTIHALRKAGTTPATLGTMPTHVIYSKGVRKGLSNSSFPSAYYTDVDVNVLP